MWNSLGGGVAMNLKTPVLGEDGAPLFETDGELLFFTLQFDYQQKAKDWLALEIVMTGGGRVGNDGTTLITEGLSTLTEFNIGCS